MSLKQDLCRITEMLGDAFQLPAFSAAFYAGGECFTVCRGCDENTRFAIGSCTKSITAAALLSLIEKGAPGLETPVSRILPRLQLQDESLWETLTVRDLLCHTSGLPAYDLAWYPYLENFTVEDIYRVLRLAKANASRGSLWQYNNLGYALLGQIIETLSGKSWRECTEELILKPLGIDAAFSPSEAVYRGNVAEPHEWRNSRAGKVGYASIGALAAAGAIYMRANELLKWDVCLLHEGKTEAGQILAPESVRQMTTPQINVSEEIAPFVAEAVKDTGYGLALNTERFQNVRVIYHTGSIDGFHALQCFLPERDFAAVFLCNLGGTAVREAFRYAVCGRVLNDPTDYVHLLKKKIVPEEENKGVSSADNTPEILRDLLGTWSDPLFGELRLERTGEGLEACLGRFRMPVMARRQGLSVNVPEIGELPMELLRDSAEKVTALSLKLEPAADAAVFERKEE